MARGTDQDLEQSWIDGHGPSTARGMVDGARAVYTPSARDVKSPPPSAASILGTVVLPSDLRAALGRHGEGLAVLVVRLGAFGDILRTLPPVRLVRFALPDARIDWICDERWAAFLSRHPDLDDVVAIPRAALERAVRSPLSWGSAFAEVRQLRALLRAKGYGLTLDFHGNLRSGIVTRLSGARVRVGYSGHQQKEGNLVFTTHRVESGSRRVSRMERNLDLVRALGLPASPIPDAGLPETPGAQAQAAALLRETVGEESPFALINPGASRAQAYKKPPAELLAAACLELSSRDVPSLVVWGPGEEEDAAAVVRGAPDAARRCPPTSLDVLAALLRRAALLVTGDTGPLHLACAVGCPVVAVYGPTDPEVNAPWRVPYVVVAPPGRRYTGIKSVDRSAGGFEGIALDAVARAAAVLLDGVPEPPSEKTAD